MTQVQIKTNLKKQQGKEAKKWKSQQFATKSDAFVIKSAQWMEESGDRKREETRRKQRSRWKQERHCIKTRAMHKHAPN